MAAHLVTTPDTGAAACGAAGTYGRRLPGRHYPGLLRLNLAEGWSVEMAEEFRTSYRALFGEERVDPYWALLDAADVLLDLPDRSPAQVLPGHGRFEDWIRQAVVELG